MLLALLQDHREEDAMALKTVRFARYFDPADSAAGTQGGHYPYPSIDAGDDVRFYSKTLTVTLSMTGGFTAKFENMPGLVDIRRDEAKTFRAKGDVDLNQEFEQKEITVLGAINSDTGTDLTFQDVNAQGFCANPPGN